MTRPHSAGSVRLSIARHGEAHCNTSGTICGPNRCTGLTDRGRHQARRLADRLASESPVTAVYTSTVARAVQTAEILTDALGLPIHHDLRLTPPDPGAHLDGQTWPVARTVWPADPDNPDRPLAPGGEPWNSHVHRVTAALADIMNAEAGGHVLVVGHAETVTATYQIFLAAPVLHRITLPVGHASLTQWRTVIERPNVTVTHQRWALRTHADQSHLNANTPGRVTAE